MKTKILPILFSATLMAPITLYANDTESSCDQCTLLQNIDTNTATTADFIGRTIDMFNTAFFGKLPSLGISMATMTAIPSAEENAYTDQTQLTSVLEAYYQGQTDDTTVSHNYKDIFSNFLLDGEDSATSFDDANSSASSLFLNQHNASFYSPEQKSAAQEYIALLSSSGASTLQKPDSSWLKVTDSSNSYEENQEIIGYVTNYYQLTAAQSLVDFNLAYIYAENTGQAMDDQLDGYDDSEISEAALMQYYLDEKIYNPDWHAELGSMGFGAAIKEGVELLAAIFFEAHRIENLQKMQLATQSALLASNLQTSAQFLDVKKQQMNQ